MVGDRRLSHLHALAVVFGALLGAGALYIPERVENLAGPATPIPFLAGAAGAVALSVAVAVFASSSLGDDGGPYVYLSRTWRSRLVGFLFVWPSTAAYAALLALLATYLGRLLHTLPVAPAPDVVALVVLGIVLVAHLAGPTVVGRLGLVLAGGFTLFVVVGVVAALSVVVPANFTPLFPTPAIRDSPVSSLSRATLVALFGYVGFEAVVGVARDLQRPRETLPRVLLGGVAVAGVLATAMASVTLGVIPWARLIFAQAPFVDAAASALDVATRTLLTPSLVVGTLAALVALSWAPTRTLADLGELIPPLGHTNRAGAPDVATVVVFTLSGALVVADAVAVGLFLALPAVLILYVALGVSVAALPVVNPDLYADCSFRLGPRVLSTVGLVGAGLATLLLVQSVTLDPAIVLGYTRMGPAVVGPAADPLVRDPFQSTLPALIGWETLGVLVYVAARDYREEVGVDLEPLTRF